MLGGIDGRPSPALILAAAPGLWEAFSTCDAAEHAVAPPPRSRPASGDAAACPARAPGRPLAPQQHEQGDVHRRRAVVHEQARHLGLRHRHPRRRRGVEQLREHVVRGDGHHEHTGPHGEPGPVRCRVPADQREGEQVAGQQHVHVQDQRRHVGEQARPVQQPQPADVDQRGDHRMREHRHGPGAEQPAQTEPPPRQRAQRDAPVPP